MHLNTSSSCTSALIVVGALLAVVEQSGDKEMLESMPLSLRTALGPKGH